MTLLNPLQRENERIRRDGVDRVDVVWRSGRTRSNLISRWRHRLSLCLSVSLQPDVNMAVIVLQRGDGAN